MPRLLPSLTTPDRRYSVPPKPDFASQILSGSSFDHFCSAEQQAWSLTIQSILRSSTACQSASTSSRGRIGGLTLACTAHSQSVSSRRWPTVTSRRKAICGENLLHGPCGIDGLARAQMKQVDVHAIGFVRQIG